MGSSVDIEDIDGVWESQGEQWVDWHEEKSWLETLVENVLEEVSGSQFQDVPHVDGGQIDLHDVLDPQDELPDEVEHYSEDSAQASEDKADKSNNLDGRVLGDSLSVSVLSSVEETNIGDVKWETEKIHES